MHHPSRIGCCWHGHAAAWGRASMGHGGWLVGRPGFRGGAHSHTHTSRLSRNYGPGPRVSWSFPEGEGGCKETCPWTERKKKILYCHLAASAPNSMDGLSSLCPSPLGVACCLRYLSRKGVLVQLRHTHVFCCKTEGLFVPPCRNLTPTRLDSTRLASTCCIVSLSSFSSGPRSYGQGPGDSVIPLPGPPPPSIGAPPRDSGTPVGSGPQR